MSMRAVSLALFLLLVSVVVAIAQQTSPPAPPRDQQAIILVQKAIATMGAAGAAQIQDTIVQAVFLPPGQDEASAQITTIKTKGSVKIRWEGPATVTIQNGGRLTEFKDGPSLARPSANAMHRRIEHLPALLLAQELARGDVSVAYLGQEMVNGQSTHRLRFSRLSSRGNKELDDKLIKDSELDLFLDSESFLPVKIYYIYLSETDWRRGLPMEVFYADYRSVSGLLIPFAQRTVFNGRTVYDLRLKTFAANVGLADSEFAER